MLKRRVKLMRRQANIQVSTVVFSEQLNVTYNYACNDKIGASVVIMMMSG